ncbi:MAG: hypothetical protein EBZ50_07270 [Alphaproteobacteria bacterium]|nr:hypothetical protein [Alphaproteobacteria bacterium]
MKTMLAKYPGTCAHTGAPIYPGDTIDYHGRGRSILRARASTRDIDAPDIRDAVLQLEGAYHRLVKPVSDHYSISGQSYYRNRRGRCEDAPCCGCCTI